MGDGSNTCDACGAPLIWALSVHDKPGPITREPSNNGNVLVFRGNDGQTRYVVLAPGMRAALSLQGVPLRVNHFFDCPDGDRFRKEAA